LRLPGIGVAQRGFRYDAASGGSPPEAATLIETSAVVFGVHLRRVFVVLVGMQGMTMGDAGVVRGLFVIARLVMLGRFAMMLRRMFMMLGGLFVMFVNLVSVGCHLSSPGMMALRTFDALPRSVKYLRPMAGR
jgi:hypothetical protein